MVRTGQKTVIFLKKISETATGALFGINPERLGCVVWQNY
jgi:hypothetical protein